MINGDVPSLPAFRFLPFPVVSAANMSAFLCPLHLLLASFPFLPSTVAMHPPMGTHCHNHCHRRCCRRPLRRSISPLLFLKLPPPSPPWPVSLPNCANDLLAMPRAYVSYFILGYNTLTFKWRNRNIEVTVFDPLFSLFICANACISTVHISDSALTECGWLLRRASFDSLVVSRHPSDHVIVWWRQRNGVSFPVGCLDTELFWFLIDSWRGSRKEFTLMSY